MSNANPSLSVEFLFLGLTPSAGDKNQDLDAPESPVTEAKTASPGVAEYIHIVYTFYQRCSS